MAEQDKSIIGYLAIILFRRLRRHSMVSARESSTTTGEYLGGLDLLRVERTERKKSLTRRLAGACRVPCSTVQYIPLRRETTVERARERKIEP
jgi:hypothetical protein